MEGRKWATVAHLTRHGPVHLYRQSPFRPHMIMVRYGTASRWHETLDRDARFPSNGSPAEYIERAFRSERDLSRPRCSSSTSAAHSPRNLDVDTRGRDPLTWSGCTVSTTTPAVIGLRSAAEFESCSAALSYPPDWNLMHDDSIHS